MEFALAAYVFRTTQGVLTPVQYPGQCGLRDLPRSSHLGNLDIVLRAPLSLAWFGVWVSPEEHRMLDSSGEDSMFPYSVFWLVRQWIHVRSFYGGAWLHTDFPREGGLRNLRAVWLLQVFFSAGPLEGSSLRHHGWWTDGPRHGCWCCARHSLWLRHHRSWVVFGPCTQVQGCGDHVHWDMLPTLRCTFQRAKTDSFAVRTRGTTTNNHKQPQTTTNHHQAPPPPPQTTTTTQLFKHVRFST